MFKTKYIGYYAGNISDIWHDLIMKYDFNLNN